MPLELIAELVHPATARTAMAYPEGKRAKKMENPTTRGSIEQAAQRYERGCGTTSQGSNPPSRRGASALGL